MLYIPFHLVTVWDEVKTSTKDCPGYGQKLGGEGREALELVLFMLRMHSFSSIEMRHGTEQVAPFEKEHTNWYHACSRSSFLPFFSLSIQVFIFEFKFSLSFTHLFSLACSVFLCLSLSWKNLSFAFVLGPLVTDCCRNQEKVLLEEEWFVVKDSQSSFPFRIMESMIGSQREAVALRAVFRLRFLGLC